MVPMQKRLVSDRFRNILKIADAENIPIYEVDNNSYLGKYDNFERIIEISTICKEIGFSHELEEVVVLHELGHKKHRVKQIILVIIMGFCLILAFLSVVVMGIPLTVIFQYPTPSILAASIYLTLGIIFIAIAGSIALHREVEADDYARQMLKKLGRERQVDESHMLTMAYQPKNITWDIKIVEFFLPRKERIMRTMTRDWKWILWQYRPKKV